MPTEPAQPVLPIVADDDRLLPIVADDDRLLQAAPARQRTRRPAPSARVCAEPCPYGGEHAQGRGVLRGRCNRPVRLLGERCWQHRTVS